MKNTPYIQKADRRVKNADLLKLLDYAMKRR